MVNSAITLAGGLLSLLVIYGVGVLCLDLCRLDAGPNAACEIAPYWRLALSAITGTALIELLVSLVLFAGGGTTALQILAAILMFSGFYGLLRSDNYRRLILRLPVTSNRDRGFAIVIAVVFALNLVISIAPSTKIDELWYHMLVPRRIIEDGGLHLYREPFVASIFPQMEFQTGLSILYALGVPEAGNVINWGIGVSVIFLVAGVTARLTGIETAGWMTGAIAAVGLYSSVWYVSSGPHSLGDLATLVACLIVLFPGIVSEPKGERRLAFVSIAACTAASTKISLLPLACVLTIIAIFQTAGWLKALATAAGIWTAFYGPALVWTTMQSGSPFGVVTAALFHSRFFDSSTIAQIELARIMNQLGWLVMIRNMIPSVSAGMIAAFGVLVYGAFSKEPAYRLLFALVAGQIILIAWLLPSDFRFLGGLQYGVLILASGLVWGSRLRPQMLSRGWLVLLLLCLPWLAVQLYYAEPFLKVVSGTVSRPAFLNQFVAFTADFRVLDRILPRDAILYVKDSQPVSYYAPRPVIFTLKDLRYRRPVYEFSVGSDHNSNGPPSADQASGGHLSCLETVYENQHAIAMVYRTPGRQPLRDRVRVQRCLIND